LYGLFYTSPDFFSCLFLLAYLVGKLPVPLFLTLKRYLMKALNPLIYWSAADAVQEGGGICLNPNPNLKETGSHANLLANLCANLRSNINADFPSNLFPISVPTFGQTSESGCQSPTQP
jgi:hypothetical protein